MRSALLVQPNHITLSVFGHVLVVIPAGSQNRQDQLASQCLLKREITLREFFILQSCSLYGQRPTGCSICVQCVCRSSHLHIVVYRASECGSRGWPMTGRLMIQISLHPRLLFNWVLKWFQEGWQPHGVWVCVWMSDWMKRFEVP